MEKIKSMLEKFSEAWIACVLMMVQGDLTVFNIMHFQKATQVGVITAIAMLAASFLPWQNRWVQLWLLGAFTTIADWYTHMPMFPYESFATGFGAMLLAVIFQKIFHKEA